MHRGISTYKKTSVETASKEKILLMLYQSAIKHCKKAIEGIEENNLSKKGESISKMQEIIIELNNGLDLEVGGKIARELSSLYDYLLFSSTKANMQITKEPLESCLNVLTTLYEGWDEAIKKVKSSPRR